MEHSELLTRGVSEVIDKDHLNSRLKKGDKLVVKLGIDPTTPYLHLGHAVVLKKLAEFQKLGHKTVLVIGDFTALVGDPSGRDTQRPLLSEGDIEKNWSDYKNQASKLFDFDHTEVVRNSSWFKKMNLTGLFELTSKATLNQIIERKEFQNRLKNDSGITYLETLYPLLQAYDSVMLKADVELGGTDQKFNLLMGRQIQKRYHQNEQDIVMTPLLVGLDGKNKMSKSLGNSIGLDEEPNEMYRKIMSIPDSCIETYFELCTNLSNHETQAALKTGNYEAKKRLAYEIVSIYYDQNKAAQAQSEFSIAYSASNPPEIIPTKSFVSGPTTYVLLGSQAFGTSTSEMRRLIEQKGFVVNGKTVTNPYEEIIPENGTILKKGPHFIKLEVK